MNRSNYDSEFCGSLPIQLINLIQPYGVLLVIRKSDRTIIQVSENASEIFEIPFKDIVNRKLEEFLTADAYQQFGEYRTAKDKIPQVWRINNRSYLALIHYQADYLIVELDLMPYDESKQLSF